MYSTPRLRSAYPASPQSIQRPTTRHGQAQDQRGGGIALQSAPPSSPLGGNASIPWIPLDVIDAPKQRLFAIVFYMSLHVWRLFDYYSLVTDETDSLWLFMKWVAIDTTFFYGLPAFRIPWLEASSSTTTCLFLFHGILNGILMFRIPIPLGTWIVGMMKVVYDREIAVSERLVKPASVIHNSSLILGKQIIHIMPEGSAILNPEQDAFCIGSGRALAMLPIRINQTEPVLIEIRRIDLDSDSQEIISITGKDIRNLRKQANKELATRKAVADPQVLRYPVRKPGLYQLHKVLDVSKLEVQRRPSEALVVTCPTGAILSVPQERCKGELSNFYLELNATPPFNIKYSKTINDGEHTSASLNISPLERHKSAGVLVTLDSADPDVSWARMQTIRLPVNETFDRSGLWEYSIDEIVDACGNVIDYSRSRSETPSRGISRSHIQLQKFVVHERPKAALDGCNPENPLKVMKGKSAALPIRLISAELIGNDHQSYTVSYLFTPQHMIPSSGEHANDSKAKIVTVSDNDRGAEIQEAGLYTLQTIKSRYCHGEILEPASCLLLNPLEPDLEISAKAIPDTCAGSSIGLLVDLELVGTPPFVVTYIIRHRGYNTPRAQVFDKVRSRIELKPLEAGDYRYEFVEISDSVYVNGRSLKHKNLILEQSVRPPASAKILHGVSTIEACIEEPVLLDLQLGGEAPWNIEYELVQGGQRSTQNTDVQTQYYTLMTQKLTKGGDYALGLTSVTDRSGCKVLLKEEIRIQVRQTRPTAAFSQVEGSLKAFTLESKKINLPVRLNGEPPWTISYRNLDEPKDKSLVKQTLQYRNDVIEVDAQGVFQMMDVHDASCPGSVDTSANKFQVLWIKRPAISVVESPTLRGQGHNYIKTDVCEGDEDFVEVSLEGRPPYEVKYERHFKPDYGPKSLHSVELSPGLNLASIQMDTSQAGFHEYRFTELGDHYYAYDRRKFTPLTIQQRVQPRPSARFVNAGKTYSYCKEGEAGDEVIKIALTGLPPFHLEVGIRHHATTKPEIISIPNVATFSYDFHIPHRVLALGTHVVKIRKVRDSRGCEIVTDVEGPHVKVNVADVPTISSLETTEDYCVGDRISFVLSGTPPFNVFYDFQGASRKAVSSTTTFRRLAETPGIFTIAAVSDQRSTDACRARVNITKVIHEMPSVRISKGRTAVTDIHEGGEAEILFEFGGTPPFEFIYTRSTNAAKGRKSELLETKSNISHGHSKTIRASDEGTYEVVSIRDRYCAFSTQSQAAKPAERLLGFR